MGQRFQEQPSNKLATLVRQLQRAWKGLLKKPACAMTIIQESEGRCVDASKCRQPSSSKGSSLSKPQNFPAWWPLSSTQLGGPWENCRLGSRNAIGESPLGPDQLVPLPRSRGVLGQGKGIGRHDHQPSNHTLEGCGPSCRTNKHFIPERPLSLHLHPSLQMAAGNSVVFSRAVPGFLAWLQIPEGWGKLVSRHSLPGPGKQDRVYSGEPPTSRPLEGGCCGSWRSQG
ncbi:uncharacterized protein LOC123927163 isoform X1 [Meles meles]|uniref:uncharacterized protein LOC123927163 isoform X1 n=1 Tax=Meles meles TaxID=9662 RepID=UPI001E69EB12|nr:uncharacterized protein LOC123927163 isoform X1 [Meles meles]